MASIITVRWDGDRLNDADGVKNRKNEAVRERKLESYSTASSGLLYSKGSDRAKREKYPVVRHFIGGRGLGVWKRKERRQGK